ncbi:hypothetical protein [Streptomyces sp. WAC 01325]|uniref:hypothetical protein n=1 Tax=Streptomyces sp. WAC 01325 TaxID=2203202 RepID=UPI000F866247|nr:hypothetical protein [Streptomyces sp. WAC 01325]
MGLDEGGQASLQFVDLGRQLLDALGQQLERDQCGVQDIVTAKVIAVCCTGSTTPPSSTSPGG